MIIRPETPADHEAVARLLTDAFGGPAEARLVDLLRATDDYVPDLTLVADIDGEVVGHIAFSRVKVGEETALALAPMAVAPAHQRSGVGTALAQAALERAADRAEAAVIVLGHPEYYPRFGFVPAADYGVLAPWDVPPEAWMVHLLPAYDPAARGLVTYAAAFDAAT